MDTSSRILSSMQVAAKLHLGHQDTIKKWLELQYEHDCFFMLADLQALAGGYENTANIKSGIYEMVIDWLASGVDASQATIFVQSQVPQHSELNVLLSMITPLGWLSRVPTYREMLENREQRELGTYGFLGGALLRSVDILLYNAKYVPVSKDQLWHVDFTREIARRFNYIYGREDGFEEKALEAINRLGTKRADLYRDLLHKYQQDGNDEALEKARYLLQDALNLSLGEKDRLFAFLENKSKIILTEPTALVTIERKIPGTDGQNMSKVREDSAIWLRRDDRDTVKRKIDKMVTDPARERRSDPGDPEKCPVWQLHLRYSNKDTQEWVIAGCKSAGIGCLDCKAPLIDSIATEQEVLCERALPYLEDKNIVRNILADGAERASDIASDTLKAVKDAMHL